MCVIQPRSSDRECSSYKGINRTEKCEFQSPEDCAKHEIQKHG